MIQREEMENILNFVGRRWIDETKDPKSRVLQGLPNDFWMNSVGGTAKKGFWVTTLLYTENEADAAAFREVLLRWQTKGNEKDKSPDLIQIKKKNSE